MYYELLRKHGQNRKFKSILARCPSNDKKNPSFQTLMSNIGVKIAANLLLHEGTP